MAAVAVLSDIGMEQFCNFEPLCHCNASHRFSSIGLRVQEEMSFEEFQDRRPGGLFGYRNGTILAILNICDIGMERF